MDRVGWRARFLLKLGAGLQRLGLALTARASRIQPPPTAGASSGKGNTHPPEDKSGKTDGPPAHWLARLKQANVPLQWIERTSRPARTDRSVGQARYGRENLNPSLSASESGPQQPPAYRVAPTVRSTVQPAGSPPARSTEPPPMQSSAPKIRRASPDWQPVRLTPRKRSSTGSANQAPGASPLPDRTDYGVVQPANFSPRLPAGAKSSEPRFTMKQSSEPPEAAPLSNPSGRKRRLATKLHQFWRNFRKTHSYASTHWSAKAAISPTRLPTLSRAEEHTIPASSARRPQPEPTPVVIRHKHSEIDVGLTPQIGENHPVVAQHLAQPVRENPPVVADGFDAQLRENSHGLTEGLIPQAPVITPKPGSHPGWPSPTSNVNRSPNLTLPERPSRPVEQPPMETGSSQPLEPVLPEFSPSPPRSAQITVPDWPGQPKSSEATVAPHPDWSPNHSMRPKLMPSDQPTHASQLPITPEPAQSFSPEGPCDAWPELLETSVGSELTETWSEPFNERRKQRLVQEQQGRRPEEVEG